MATRAEGTRRGGERVEGDAARVLGITKDCVAGRCGVPSEPRSAPRSSDAGRPVCTCRWSRGGVAGGTTWMRAARGASGGPGDMGGCGVAAMRAERAKQTGGSLGVQQPAMGTVARLPTGRSSLVEGTAMTTGRAFTAAGTATVAGKGTSGVLAGAAREAHGMIGLGGGVEGGSST